jgi:stage IV sporulation protein FB
MSWSFPIARIGGTAVKIHATFLLLFLWLGVSYLIAGGPEAAVRGLVLLLLLLFLSVVLHEFGHIAVARRFGIRTRDILLLPIGGVARLDSLPEKPAQEIAIAIAGPAVSLAIAAILLTAAGGLPSQAELAADKPQLGLVVQLGLTNLVLGLFNLIPAFPMDGGRVLRALIATRGSYAKATRIAAATGQIFAFGFGLLGLLAGNPLLLLVALFVYIAAGAEAGIAQMREAVWGVTAADLMMTRLESLPADATVGDAVDALLHTSQHEFAVVDGAGRLRGVVTRDSLLAGLRTAGSDASVESAMRRDIPVLAPHASGEDCVRLLQDGGPAAAVQRSTGEFLGLITWDNLTEMLLVSAATRKSPPLPDAGPAARRLGGFA